jgi:hypothetical protein
MERLKGIHENIRAILIEYGCVEYGDVIIDEICEVVGIRPTTAYYEDLERYARRCDITGKGMNEGWCWGDGHFYSKTYEDTIKELRKDYPEHGNLSDENLLEMKYEEGLLYWTDWYDEDLEEQGYFYDEEGKEFNKD